jgi:hypothetical protein
VGARGEAALERNAGKVGRGWLALRLMLRSSAGGAFAPYGGRDGHAVWKSG